MSGSSYRTCPIETGRDLATRLNQAPCTNGATNSDMAPAASSGSSYRTRLFWTGGSAARGAAHPRS